jgi:stearoyl-CoA desaturase (delta-9 desaturase)
MPRIGRFHFDALVAFVPLHAACLLLLSTPVKWSYLTWLVVTYGIRMFAITAGYHRYFSHRSFKLNRVSQFVLAFLAQTSAQMGVFWWAAHHRVHHRYSDTGEDTHSPAIRSFWWAHIGWIVAGSASEYDRRLIQDFEKFPELRLLNKYHRVPAILFGAAVFAVGGYPAFLWGFVLSTVLLWHCTFSINSLAHLWGSRPFETGDQSRNNFFLALITLGEGWHNNHHQFMYSARQGWRWWEIDMTYYVLWILSLLGIVRELRAPNPSATFKVRTQIPSPAHRFPD